jgi:hypothetical protein
MASRQLAPTNHFEAQITPWYCQTPLDVSSLTLLHTCPCGT